VVTALHKKVHIPQYLTSTIIGDQIQRNLIFEVQIL
jgi:hypothetical protein